MRWKEEIKLIVTVCFVYGKNLVNGAQMTVRTLPRAIKNAIYLQETHEYSFFSQPKSRKGFLF